MPSFLSLPLELIDEVISIATHPEDDRDTYPDPTLVAQCSLVCKTFYRIARELHFREVLCTLDEKDARLFHEIVTYQHKDLSLPPLTRCVQEIDLVFDVAQHAFNEGYLDHLDAFLAPFSGDACRVRYFTFSAKKDRHDGQIMFPTTLSWHELRPTTRGTFTNIFQSSSLETLDIYGMVNLPFRLLRSVTPNIRFLSLISTSVAVEPEDLDPSTTQIVPPLPLLEELNIGGLEFKLVKPPIATSTESHTAGQSSGVTLDVCLSRLIDLSKLDTLVVLKVSRDNLIGRPTPPLQGLFARCSDLQGFKLEFVTCADLYPLGLDKLPSSVWWLEIDGFTSHPFVSGLNGSPDTQATSSSQGEPVLLPANIASSSSSSSEFQLSDVCIRLPVLIHHYKDSQIETLVLADGSTPYWDAVLENLLTIPASNIHLDIEISFKTYRWVTLDGTRPEARPDEKIEAEVNRVFGAYNKGNPDKPINMRYRCAVKNK